MSNPAHNPFGRRAFLRGGLTVTAAGALGLADPLLAGAAESAAPPIHGTGAWGARAPSGGISVLNSRPVKIIVHHTATGNVTDYSLARAFALSRSIQNYHMDSNRWIDTGQHFTNSRGGHITEGRHRSLAALNGGTQHVVSAHTSGQNNVALGIENEGLYTSVGPTTAQWNSLVQLCKYMCAQYRIPASQIFGHRDFNNTACPGNVLYGRLPELRRSVAAAMGSREKIVDPVTWPLLQPGDRGEKVLAAQRLLHHTGERGVPLDGVFDQRTDEAARRLEVRIGVAETGLVGAESWPALVPAALRKGDRGDAVHAAQLLLVAAGLRSPADGEFTEATQTAVKDLQTAQRIPATGVIDLLTWQYLLR
ncbi:MULTISPECIES: N-acetylmuramoyl-L-alanine amidase [unclassified Crossiella]|uniref:peptidoglycan recognition protein family protein n=1 Tax=unclassified Crossiella TaxID=2620835 RepID=UPI001FFED36B|nr:MULTISPECIES: N-acetylmuramoyl-L-alanine amidase [unclassified Crossiella]MCK2243845.1 N-acetylmuramoyl-L-alanine amidase [Crossiella sp. S99.2]MCK2257704.1 N-acetylmuramoyl-L-alanine amidase [Crossiella sp. S99.1]